MNKHIDCIHLERNPCHKYGYARCCEVKERDGRDKWMWSNTEAHCEKFEQRVEKRN